jgi:hypothetical protein
MQRPQGRPHGPIFSLSKIKPAAPVEPSHPPGTLASPATAPRCYGMPEAFRPRTAERSDISRLAVEIVEPARRSVQSLELSGRRWAGAPAGFDLYGSGARLTGVIVARAAELRVIPLVKMSLAIARPSGTPPMLLVSVPNARRLHSLQK